jgi:hypothetical protein
MEIVWKLMMSKVNRLIYAVKKVSTNFNKESECEKWKRRIEEMKTKCNNHELNEFQASLSNSSLNPPDTENTMKKLSQQVLDEEKRIGKQKEAKLNDQFAQFKKQIQDLMDKEDNYEKNLEDQEKERISKEREKMNSLLKNEESKANDLVSQLEQLGKGDGFSAKERALKRKMKTMMYDIQKKINQKRTNLMNKLKRMKKLHAMEQRMAAKKLLDIKKNMGKKLANLSKKGNPNQCFSIRTPEAIQDYCSCNYKDSLLNKECNDKSQFCYMCCDNEIGKLNKDNLECCYNKCDKVASEKCDSFSQVYHIKTVLPHHHHIFHGAHIPHVYPLHHHAHHVIHGDPPHVHHVIHGHLPHQHVIQAHLHGNKVHAHEQINLFP